MIECEFCNRFFEMHDIVKYHHHKVCSKCNTILHSAFTRYLRLEKNGVKRLHLDKHYFHTKRHNLKRPYMKSSGISAKCVFFTKCVWVPV